MEKLSANDRLSLDLRTWAAQASVNECASAGAAQRQRASYPSIACAALHQPAIVLFVACAYLRQPATASSIALAAPLPLQA